MKTLPMVRYQKTRGAAFANALSLFKEAARRVPAYKDFLRKARINPDRIITEAEFREVPVTDKPNYIDAYPLKALSWDGALKHATFISSSSGSTGTPYYWPRGDEQGVVTGAMFQRLYEQVFDTAKGSSLFVDMFALGPWIAGLEFYNATKHVADHGSVITIATPSFDKTAALDTIKRLGSSFDRLILAGYPPFVKDILESGVADGIDWSTLDVRLFTAGESFSEKWRDRIAETVGTKKLSRIINLYGMAETGAVGHETPLSIALRRNVNKLPTLKKQLSFEGTVAALYQYNPMMRYLEVGSGKNLILTSQAGLPLIRYNTRDEGGIVASDEAAEYLRQIPLSPSQRKAAAAWQLPLVYLYGRRDLSLSFYALNIYVENIKHCLEHYLAPENLSGLFIMRIGHDKNLDQQFEIFVELSQRRRPTRHEEVALTDHVVRTLARLNSEYAKTCATLGKRAHPLITLLPYGTIDTVPGKKHRWVRRA